MAPNFFGFNLGQTHSKKSMLHRTSSLQSNCLVVIICQSMIVTHNSWDGLNLKKFEVRNLNIDDEVHRMNILKFTGIAGESTHKNVQFK